MHTALRRLLKPSLANLDDALFTMLNMMYGL